MVRLHHVPGHELAELHAGRLRRSRCREARLAHYLTLAEH